jgi:hypothetical protein
MQGAGAIITPCQRYRYLLWRRWNDEKATCAFIALNPSKADATRDDPTVRRMVGFARAWGYGELWVLNAYAWRATDPKVLRGNSTNVVGALNNDHLRRGARDAALVVAAWGNHCGELRERQIRDLLKPVAQLHHLGLTATGHPRHPLYLRADTKPQPWD